MSAGSLQEAIQKHQQGLLDEAGALYGQILTREPNNLDALRLMSMVAEQRGDTTLAISLAEQAIRLAPRVSALYLALASPLLAAGRVEEAIKTAKDALQRDKRNVDALLFLGDAYQQKQAYAEALDCYRKALQLDRSIPELYNNQGNARRGLGELDAALGCYQQAIALNPNYVDAYFNLGNTYRDLQRFDEAMAAYQQVIALNPRFYQAYVMCGVVLRSAGQPEQAEALYQQAIQLMPEGSSEAALAWYNFGNLYLGLKDYDRALPCYAEALAISPEYQPALYNCAQALFEQGQAADAIEMYARLAALCPDSAAYRINQALTLPVLYEDQTELLDWRERYEKAVDDLLATDLPPLDAQFVEQLASTGFYLAYQGLADKPLQVKVGQLFRKLLGFPSLECRNSSEAEAFISSSNANASTASTKTAAASCSADGPSNQRPKTKPRIGFISRHLSSNHTIGKLLQGIILHLSRDLFEVHVFSVGAETAYVKNGQEHPQDCFYELPIRDTQGCCRILHDADLDVLYFTDIGMDVATYLLCHYRFAPVQCTTWGHPVTTGSPNMDYFISSQYVETPDSDAHYLETLVRLENYPFYYYHPILDAPTVSRADLGFEPHQTLYACVQSLFKIHPDTDFLFGEILRRDPNGVLVLLSHQSDVCTSRLYTRLTTQYPDIADRVRFVNRLPRTDFLSLMAISDVLLDSIYFSGGNTSYEGLAFGTPIITLDTPYMKGRLTLGLYKKMGLMTCVAATLDEYVELAVRYGTDASARDSLRAEILARCSVLYEDIEPVRELEAFLVDALHKRGLYLDVSIP